MRTTICISPMRIGRSHLAGCNYARRGGAEGPSSIDPTSDMDADSGNIESASRPMYRVGDVDSYSASASGDGGIPPSGNLAEASPSLVSVVSASPDASPARMGAPYDANIPSVSLAMLTSWTTGRTMAPSNSGHTSSYPQKGSSPISRVSSTFQNRPQSGRRIKTHRPRNVYGNLGATWGYWELGRQWCGIWGTMAGATRQRA